MPRVGVIALLQESNTFLAERTHLDHFRRDLLLTGDGIRSALADAHHEVGGFFAGLDRAQIDAVPIFAARAMPYGTLKALALTQLMEILSSAIDAAGPLDGLLVAPHGATASENVCDVDGHWLSLVREAVGEIPIIGTIDPHANLSASMVDSTDALIAYRTNPHIDQRARGMEAARLMARTLTGDIRPTQSAAFPPLAINIECQSPGVFPCLPHYQAAASMHERFDRNESGPVARGEVLSASIVLGFPYADVPEMGSAALVVTNDSPAAAASHARTLGDGLWRDRHTFLPVLLGVDAAMDSMMALPGPVCLLDMGDNVGGGSPADGTALARAFFDRQIAGSFVCLCDESAARAAKAVGVGASIWLAVGGRSSEWAGVAMAEPLAAEWQVWAISDGRFTESQPRHGGSTAFDQGLTAVLVSNRGLTVMVTSQRMAPFSLGQIRHVGLDPAGFRFLAAKGVHAPVAAYSEVCQSFVRIDTPGVTTADLSRLTFNRRRRPMFPFECTTQR
jgi:microcystin degradation protein MlrC